MTIERIKEKLKNKSIKDDKLYLEMLQAADAAMCSVIYGLKLPCSKYLYTTKGKKLKDTGGNTEFGYYTNKNVCLPNVVERLGVKSIIDLGCGPGLVIKTLKQLNYVNKIKGFDNEADFISIAKGRYSNHNEEFTKKDITKLTKEDLEYYDAVYFWEPIICPITGKKFIKNLVKNLKKDTFILYYRSGQLHVPLEQAVEDGKLSVAVQHGSIAIYTKL